jgi:arsenate reductase-like glutaredoxin family protein
VSAKKVNYPKKEVLALLRDIDEIYATKGRSVVHVNLKKDRPDETKLFELLIGRTGNLRAPVLRIGRKLIVGFDEATYKRFLD